jgi:hypothetical protein
LVNTGIQGAIYSDWEPWVKRYGLLSNGKTDFSVLPEEPCRVFEPEMYKKHNPGWDLKRDQCANVRTLEGTNPCDQWKVNILANVGRTNAQGPPVEPWSEARDAKLIADCRVHNSIFQRSFKPPARLDENDYSRYDFSAPPGVVEDLSPLLGYASWVAMATGIAGIMICGARLVIMRHHEVEQHTAGIIVVMVAATVASSAGAVARFFLSG